jgi:hypothetical protein
MVLCSRYKDSPQVQRSWDQIPVEARFPTLVQTGPGTHPTHCTVQWAPGLSCGGTAMRHGVDNSPPPITEVKEREQLYLYSTSGPSWTVPRWTLLYSYVNLGRFHPFIGHEGPYLTSALEGVRGQRHAPAAPYPLERPSTHCTGDWVGLRAGLDRCGKSRPHRYSIPGLSSP